jgi:hypothetical protein
MSNTGAISCGSVTVARKFSVSEDGFSGFIHLALHARDLHEGYLNGDRSLKCEVPGVLGMSSSGGPGGTVAERLNYHG